MFHLITLILHMLGAGLTLGIVLLSLFAVIRPPVTTTAIEHLKFAGKFGMGASAWQFISGLMLVMPEWNEFRGNTLFWTKILIYTLDGFLASMLLAKQAKRAAQNVATGNATTGAGLRNVAWVHALLIMAVAVIGVILVSGGQE